ncbi:MAG TPA: hypothetical protein PK722_05780 [Kiritimatiellia bacterium]|nr:hypothetical protein [Kiritimatiellia bacterium]
MKKRALRHVVLTAAFCAVQGLFAETPRGDINGWGTNWMTADTDFGSIYKVTITSTATRATSGLKFDQSGNWNPQWGYKAAYSTNAAVNSTIGQARINDGGDPSDLSFSETSGWRYTFNLKGTYEWWDRPYVIMGTEGSPVSVLAVSDNHDTAATNAVTVTIQLSAAKSAQENVWVRYTKNAWTNSYLTAQAAGSSTNYTAAIPASPTGSVIEYYVLTSTMPSNIITADFDLCTLRGKKSGATNYQYSVGTPPANLGNCWHIPTNTEPFTATMRNPAGDPSTNQAVYIYNGSQYQGAGNPGDQTGGWLFHKKTDAGSWSSNSLSFDSVDSNNKYWVGLIPAGTYAASDEVQYYLLITYNDHDDTWIGTTNSGASSLTFADAGDAQGNPFTFTYSSAAGQSPEFVWHADNRVVSGTSAQFWAKIGYAQGIGTNRWADYAAVYYTTNGTEPHGHYGAAGNASTKVVAMSFDHMEEDSYPDADAMWWQGTATGLPSLTTIKYKIGAWKTTNDTERYADYGTAGTASNTFSFAIGTAGAQQLTVGTLNADYTTTKFFIDEVNGDTEQIVVTYVPGALNLDKVEIFSNLDRRDYADADYNTDGVPDGIRPPSGDLITTNDTGAYFRAYPMTPVGGGAYVWTGTVSRCGAYRLTARYSTNGMAAGSWHWYSSAGRRDHAVVVSPKKVLEMTMYELNPLTVEATYNDEAGRSTFRDLLGSSEGDTDGFDPFNLDYLNYIQANCLWFQPIHPSAETTRGDPSGYSPGSPYATRDYYAVSPYLGADGTEAGALAEFTNFVAACDAYTGSVGTVNVMLDGVFNHTAWDAVMGQGGLDLGFCTNKNDHIGWFKPGWYALWTDYGEPATYYHSVYSNDFATAPDRGDFGKWADVAEFYFGKYSALVRHNPDNNGDYLNEDDVYDYTGMSADTIDLWKYFGYYTEYWLKKTGHSGTNTFVRADDDRGIDGLRCDFGQGLPPQTWEYIINRTRSMKWNFIFMAETLDGGKPGYRSNRHFDVLNENLVFQFTQAQINDSWSVRSALEDRRNAYNGGAVLLNLTSHDEVLPDNDCWLVASRYGAVSTVDGIPMIFYGQEQGIQNYNADPSYWYYDGFRTDHEENFGKFIPHFKQWNQLMVWSNPPPNAEGLAQWYGRVNWARLNSPALQSQNRYFLSKVGGGEEGRILAVAKYEEPYASPNDKDVVLAFALMFRHGEAHTGASATYDLTGAWDLLGLDTGTLYQVRNLASSDASAEVWGSPISGASLYNDGIFVQLNGGTAGGSITNDGELVQYLKLVEVDENHAPVISLPGPHILPVGAYTNFEVTASDPDSDPVTLTNTVAPAGATYVGTTFSWTAGASDAGSTSLVVFVANDGQGEASSVVTNSTVIVVPADWDADGIGDDWEWNRFSSLTNNPADDADGDGKSNHYEYITDTDPLDDGSFYQNTITSAVGRTVLNITAGPPTSGDRVYDVVWSTNLTESMVNWTRLNLNLPGTGGAVVLSVTNNGSAGYYRTMVTLP